MGFPEWGLLNYSSTSRWVGYGGGDNPYFIQKMHDFFMDPANKVVMHAYFDVSNSHEGDYRIGPSNTRHPLASAKYRQLFRTGSHVQNGQTGSTGVTSAPPGGGATVSAPVSQVTDSTNNTRARPLPLMLR